MDVLVNSKQQTSVVAKDLLIESFANMKKKHGIDLRNPANNIKVVADDAVYGYYVESLLEPFSPKDRILLRGMCDGTRQTLLFENANSRFGMSSYEVLSLPLIPVFFPRLIAKELVTFATTDKPEIIKPIMRASFKRFNDSTVYDAPAVGSDMSTGPQIGIPVAVVVNVPGQTDLLALQGLTPDSAHIEKNLIISEVGDGTHWAETQSIPTVDGSFYMEVTIPSVGNDIVTGKIDYLNGILTLSSLNGRATKAKLSCTVSVEENTVSTKLSITVDKIRIPIIDRELEVDYTLQQKMDLKALYDIDLEAMLLNLMAKQIALDIDRQIINAMVNVVQNPTLVPVTHIQTFHKTPPVGFDWGPKMWHENIVTNINELAAIVANDTYLGEANRLSANTIDAAVLRDLNTYRCDFDRMGKNNVGYKAAEIAGGAQMVLDSPIQPRGQMLIVFKPEPTEEEKSVFYLIMHTPGIVQPYPKTNKPTFSVLTRYGTAFVHHKGLAMLNIVT